MEMFWFFQLQFHRTYDSTYNSDFWFSQNESALYAFAYDSIQFNSLFHTT